MTSSPALTLTGIEKQYRRWATPGSRLWVPLLYRLSHLVQRISPALGERIRRHAQARIHTHQALHGISFSLQRGDALGIIGHNGSGKSTLLQIVAGVLQPSAGTVKVNGKVAALLELGSGFNMEMSGRENIRVNAAILGLSQAQVRARMDDIIAFADIGDYIDEPVKTYSSGMALRLAFAVQVHTDPDILIVDEALAVGDAAFQAKAMARIDEILARGTTLLFVGHDLNAVKAFCHRAMLLEKGRIVCEGLPDEVITDYLHRTHKRALASQQAQQRGDALERLEDGYGLATARVTTSSINGLQHVAVAHAAPLQFEFKVHREAQMQAPGLIFDIMDGRGLQLTGRRIALPVGEGAVSVEIKMQASFQQGIYRIRTRVVDAPRLEQTTILARQEGRLSFEVVDDSRHQFTGLFPVPMDITTGGCQLMPRMLFHRQFTQYSGGHGKVWDYFRHALALGWDARVYLTPDSLRDATNPWMQMPERIVPHWEPENCDLLFLAGMDWTALADIQHPPRPVINLISHVRHAWPEHPLSAFLPAPAQRICISQPIADALAASGRVNGPMHLILAALDLPPNLLEHPPQTGAHVLVSGLKAPALAQALTLELQRRNIAVERLEHLLPRDDYYTRVAQSAVAVTLPHPAEGFYLPALEAMALGVPVVLTDCIGSRQYTRDGENCLLAVPEPAALADAVERALQPALRAQLIQHGHATASAYTQAAERERFADILRGVAP